jgi:hypothetical protein
VILFPPKNVFADGGLINWGNFAAWFAKFIFWSSCFDSRSSLLCAIWALRSALSALRSASCFKLITSSVDRSIDECWFLVRHHMYGSLASLSDQLLDGMWVTRECSQLVSYILIPGPVPWDPIPVGFVREPPW